jgi:hypothetical protein
MKDSPTATQVVKFEKFLKDNDAKRLRAHRCAPPEESKVPPSLIQPSVQPSA